MRQIKISNSNEKKTDTVTSLVKWRVFFIGYNPNCNDKLILT
ncbi:hypothetical protein LDG_5884 [Legionella drancourtii LLAP12]|uniref:Uncharacterized protein n=1 Tax=Legionella drancourtii LLAP12 TaxID=658187 RepID=G9EKZ0_9GAMM|nr:hypothetical protein LDG_5884 [Legionella drancourtii LLAP12]